MIIDSSCKRFKVGNWKLEAGNFPRPQNSYLRESSRLHSSTSLSKYCLQLMVLSLLFCTSCEEYFNPELEGTQPLLVVEGAITNLEGPYTVKLLFSSGIVLEDQQVVENATVKIIEEGGEEETLTETIAGTYSSSDNGIQGTPNKSYKLYIQLQDGTQYESTFQKMPTLIPIDTVETAVEFRYLNINEQNVPGYQFNISSGLAENSENYLLWSMESTFKYRSDFRIDYIYTDYMAQVYPNPTEFMTCWRTDQINEIFTFKTSLLSEPKIERFPLNFARADKLQLYIRYSLLVKQFTINKEAYTFWNKIQGQIESQESLYNSQPFQIRGNIFNVDDPEETVLGFFMAAAQDERRLFVDPPPDLEFTKESCFLDVMGYSFISRLPQSSWPIYIFEDEFTGSRGISSEQCFDCTKRGGTIVRPEFWVD